MVILYHIRQCITLLYTLVILFYFAVIFLDIKKPSEEILEGHNFIIWVGLFARYYSMIVATRPEPTVLPPSRFLVMIYIIANGDKYVLFINLLTVFDSNISVF